MKLLKICVPNGYMMLKKGFTINFLSKTRVNKDYENNDLYELEDGLYLPLETAFIGKNSSGKTTVLRLISNCLDFISEGRIVNNVFNDENFKLEVVFYEDDYLYEYKGEFKNESSEKKYLTIVNEFLGKTVKKASYKKDLSNASFTMVKSFIPNIDMDTSNITKFKFNTGFSCFLNYIEKNPKIFELFCMDIDEDVFANIIRLFDDSIEYIKVAKNELGFPLKNNTFNFKRINEKAVLVSGQVLESLLSDGTVRGLKFYSSAILAFKHGGTLLVDEIERNFNKNLIYNLIDMFNDERINKNHANLIYSTHYSEVLDNSNRCDNINVLHRDGNEITMKNMSVDYQLRTQLKKSELFDQNAFDNLINYENLIALKRSIRK